MRYFTCNRCKQTFETDLPWIDEEPDNIYKMKREIYENKSSYCDDCFLEFKTLWRKEYGQEFPFGFPESELPKEREG
jgi:hypothetical protein